MLYVDFLRTVKDCPFCKITDRDIIKENELAYITPALAPYSPYHLLVVPKRHSTDYLDLNPEERVAIDQLINDGIKAIEKLGIDDYSLMVRIGNNKSIGKSVGHTHFHIVPKARLGMLDANGDDRSILTQKEFNDTVKKVKNLI